MRLKGNTIFITGGGSGIGRGFAEAFHKLGNQVIIAGRRRKRLDAVVAANPGMAALELDIGDPASIESVARRLIREYPDVNVLINNAGIMQVDRTAGRLDDALLLETVNTNLIGSIRMTSALIEHLKMKDGAVVAYTSSVLGFVPLALTAVYSATKAALHSYALSQRFMLRDSTVRVIEIVPPWVRTELMNSQEAEQAMPINQFIGEAIRALGTNADEIVIDAAKPLRGNVGPGEHAFVGTFNERWLANFSESPVFDEASGG
ncbi:MAG TPA: SDR family NAD(P)-dependent oxidoreductase [Steroidobacteraceae bacterium]|nr:SDR family NAD(P)-dependent oxidoreductase [Steroidobacteraceae bacterium]